MKIKTEQDMMDFCKSVNEGGNPFDITRRANLPPEEAQSRLAGIIMAEPPKTTFFLLKLWFPYLTVGVFISSISKKLLEEYPLYL